MGLLRYHCISLSIWNDDNFPFVSDDCQLVFFHILTTPLSTSFGLFKASVEGLAAEKRWSLPRYKKAFQEALDKGFIKYDERVQLVYIPNFLKYNKPGNPNVVKGWGKSFNELPVCLLKAEFYFFADSFMRGLSEAFHKAFSEAFDKAFTEAFAEGFQKPLAKVLVNDNALVIKEGVQGDENPQPVDNSGPDVKAFLARYVERFTARYGNPPVVKKADAINITGLMKTYGPEQMDLFLGTFFASPDRFILENGHALGIFVTKINMLIAAAATPMAPNGEQKPDYCIGKACGDFGKKNSEGACFTTCTKKPTKEAAYA